MRMCGHPGIGRYIRELADAMVLDDLSGLELVFMGYTLRARPAGVSYKKLRSGIYSLSEQCELPLKSAGIDLLHVPHFNVPVLWPKRMVATVHDLIYFHDPIASRSRFGRAYTAFLMKTIARKASRVITVSQYTRQDLLTTFKEFRPEQVRVIHEAASPAFRKIDDAGLLEAARRRLALQGPLVLFVGSLKRHKNVLALIRAFVALKQKKGLPHTLVLVGRADTNYPDVLKEAARHTFIRHLGELNDDDLVALYNLSDAFVLPSLWEGFGIPLLEAMACGTPVIASDRCSIPEVVGEAAALFDAPDVDALEDVLYNVLKDKELRNRLSKKGLERAQAFSWQRAAKETLEVYRQALA